MSAATPFSGSLHLFYSVGIDKKSLKMKFSDSTGLELSYKDKDSRKVAQGSYRQVWVKFKDFSMPSKSLSNSIQWLKVNQKYWYFRSARLR